LFGFEVIKEGCDAIGIFAEPAGNDS
jgi:hypothetical protein